MVSKLIERNNAFYCSNCQMKQSNLKNNCWWCGCIFSNLEDILIKQTKEQLNEEIY